MKENKLPTATELYHKELNGEDSLNSVEKCMIEFAKLHCEAQRKAILEEVLYTELSVDWKTFYKTGCIYLDKEGKKNLKDSIINAYPLDKIQ